MHCIEFFVHSVDLVCVGFAPQKAPWPTFITVGKRFYLSWMCVFAAAHFKCDIFICVFVVGFCSPDAIPFQIGFQQIQPL